MHCADLGVVQYLVACVLFDVFHEIGGVESRPGDQLSYLLTLIRQAGKTLGFEKPAINKLTMTMIHAPGQAPKMRTKASEGRKLLASLKHMLEHMVPQNDSHQQLRYQCVNHMVLIYDELAAWGASSGERVAALGRKALVLYGELQMEDLQKTNWQRRGFVLFRLYPKMHQLQHCLEDQVRSSGNPKEHWCYCDESEIGAGVKVAESVHPSMIHRGVLQKHRLCDW